MYYIIINDGIIIAIGEGLGGTKIDKDEYEEIMDMIRSKPEASVGFEHVLTVEKEWVLREKPPEPEEEPITPEQIISRLEEIL